MKISIVTPSFRNSDWLKLCIESVADQAGVDVEHIVQDSKSDDGTQDWLPHEKRVKAFIEKDSGMYDAVNRGWRRASGEILAYLNCDEQYLPGALAAVENSFRQNPETDVLFADTVVVDKEGRFMCCRKSLVPWENMMWAFNPVITSSIFIHRRVLDEHGLFFDTKWRDLGDLMWMVELVQHQLRMRVLRQYTSSFADTGENMNLKPNAIRERQEVAKLAPGWVQRSRWLLWQMHRVRALFAGAYSQKPFTYSIYTFGSPKQRVEFTVDNPTCIWRSRH